MSSVVQFFKELGPLRIIIGILTFLLLLVFLMFYLYKVSNHSLAVLYSGLELEDSNKIIQEVEARGISYEIAGGGSIVKVPEDQVLRLRVALSEKGIPGKGSVVGYEIFDNQDSLGTTSFMQNIKLIRALEGELSRTITHFEKIDKAMVHLVIPKKELFSKERQEPRASVVLKLRSGRALSKSEVDSVTHIVATAVPELAIKNITIVDTKGKSLKLGLREDSELGYASSINDERRLSYESRIKSSVESLLERTIGSGKVIAQINVEMNFDRIVQNSETYDPDGAVLRSSQIISESESNSSGEENMDVSVANNVPGADASEQSVSSGASIERSDETQNFEISKTITNKIQDIGEVKKLSIAILVDGSYQKDPETGENKYIPRSEEELKQIEELVKVAVGFDPNREDRIQVTNMKFETSDYAEYEDTSSEWIKSQLPTIIQTIVVAAIIILILLTVIRPVAMRTFDIKKEEIVSDDKLKGSLAEILGDSVKASSDEDLMLNISKARDQNIANDTGKKVNQVTETDPQLTASLIKRWLNED